MFYACFSNFSTNKWKFLFLIIVGSKCVAIGKKLSDCKQLCPMDPIDRSIGLWLTDNAHGRIRLRRKPAGEKCYKDCITHFLHCKTCCHIRKTLSDGK